MLRDIQVTYTHSHTCTGPYVFHIHLYVDPQVLQAVTSSSHIPAGCSPNSMDEGTEGVIMSPCRRG